MGKGVYLKRPETVSLLEKARFLYLKEFKVTRVTNEMVIKRALKGYVNDTTKKI